MAAGGVVQELTNTKLSQSLLVADLLALVTRTQVFSQFMKIAGLRAEVGTEGGLFQGA